MDSNSHWTYQNKILEEIPQDIFGYVYKIVNLISEKYYIGRKYSASVRRKAVKGKTRKKVIRTESNWKTYTGSNIQLNEDIKKYGKENFRFEIVAFGYTKGQVNFLEEHLQHRLAVVVDENSYNDAIGSGKFRSVKFDDRLKEQIRNIKI